MTSLPHAFLQAMHSASLPKQGCGILVAFSGGADSVALLHMVWSFTHKNEGDFKHYTIPVLALHVHHGIRGEEADRDADFCQSFCASHGIPYALIKVDAPALAKKEHLTLEEAARKARYGAICDYLLSHHEYTHVLTAHHSDDQAETLLFRLLRGSGAKGLSGIAKQRPLSLANETHATLLRPLLELSKKELLAYCEKNALSYVFDSTNDENDAARNRIRNAVIPQLSEINPAFTDALVRFSKLQAIDDAYLSAKAEEAYRALTPKNGGYSIDDMRALDDAILTRVIGLWYADTLSMKSNGSDAVYDAPLKAEHLLAATKHIRSLANALLPFPSGLILSVDQNADTVRLTYRENTPKQETLSLEYNRAHLLSNGATVLISDQKSDTDALFHDLQNIYKFVISTTINSDTIHGDLFLRQRESNFTDHYLCGGSKKSAKDALSAHKVPLHLRSEIPLICDDEGVVWIPFCGIRDDVNPKNAAHIHPVTIYYFYNDV